MTANFYTGRRAAFKLCTMMAELSLRTHQVTPIPSLGYFEVSLSFHEFSSVVSHNISLEYLDQINGAIKGNQALQEAYSQTRAAMAAMNDAWILAHKAKTRAIESGVAAEAINATFNAKMKPYRDDVDAALARSSPGFTRAGGDFRVYLSDLEARVDAACGLTAIEEKELMAVSPDWVQEWDAFEASVELLPLERTFLSGLRMRSGLGIPTTDDLLREPYALANFRSAITEMPKEKMASLLAFTREMTLKRFPGFAPSACVGMVTVDEMSMPIDSDVTVPEMTMEVDDVSVPEMEIEIDSPR